MKIDIENILLRRLFVIKHTEHPKVYSNHLKETVDLLEKIENGEVNYIEKDGFVYFYDKEEVITDVIKVVQMEEVEGFEGISYRENGKLYRWNFGSKNELIFRNRGVEEKKRLKFLPSGFYYVANKIDEQGCHLYWISQKLANGEFTHHKTVGRKKGDTGTLYAFTERKNRGKIFRLLNYENLLKDEQKQLSSDHLILSAYVSNNDVVFEKILRLYVPHGSTVADVTYGQGRFWSRIPRGLYQVLPSDLSTGVDCRNLLYDDDSLDCVVFDPPYLSTPFGKSSTFGRKSSFEQGYKNIRSRKHIYEGSGLEDHEALVDLYIQTAVEALRVLKRNGIFIVKCQDEITSGRQRITHCEILNELTKLGCRIEDIFIVVRKHKPVMQNVLQQHARKNHSYFLVFRKVSVRRKQR